MKKSRGIIVLSLLILCACGDKAPESPSFSKRAPLAHPVQSAPPQSLNPARPKPEEPKPVAPIPPEKSTTPMTSYDPQGKPDPFQPAEALSNLNDGQKPNGFPLKQFEITDYELVGIISGPRVKKAVLQDLSGKGYLVQVGTSIGKRGGKIIRISDKEIIIEEPFQDFLGRKTVRLISLKLPKPQ